MGRPTVSVVSVYNDESILDDWLQSGLERQAGVDYESVFVDNRDDEYDSAPAALNAGGEQASGDYLLFVHQDVRLLVDDWLDRAVEYLDDLDDCGIAGVAGVTAENGRNVGRNIIYHGLPVEEVGERVDDGRPYPDEAAYLTDEHIEGLPAGPTLERRGGPRGRVVRPWIGGNEIDAPTPVRGLDELLVCVPAPVFEERGFNEDLCDGWHLYAIEYCLYVRHRMGLTAYTLPLPAWHRSTGMEKDSDFFRILTQIAAEYHDDTNWIYATTGFYNTSLHRFGIRNVDSLLYGVQHPGRALQFVKERPGDIFQALRS